MSWDTGNGSFHTTANWTGGIPLINPPPPGGNDIARFGRSSDPPFQFFYTVSFSANVTNQALRVEDDLVTFDLNGRTYLLTTATPITIGNSTSTFAGVLTITDGTVGATSADSTMTIGVGGAGSATVTTGGLLAGSLMDIRVGGAGGGTLTINNGGDVIADVVTISDFSDNATVTGSGSSLVARGLLIGGDLAVTDGGIVESTFGTIAASQFDNAEAVVEGPGSRWSNSGSLIVGDLGAGKLKIRGGGRVSSTDAFIGARARDTFFFDVNALVTDANSTWDINGRLGVGGNSNIGSNGRGTLAITDGGSVIVTRDTSIFSGDTLFLYGGTLSTTEISFPTSELGQTKGTFDWDSGTLHVGVFHGDLTVPHFGVLAPGNTAGSTFVLGDYDQAHSGATLQIDIGGTTQGFLYDVVSVTGNVSLGGQLQLDLLDGFVPGAASRFTILDATGIVSGAFANVASGQRLKTSDGAGSFVVNYGAGSPFVVLSEYRALIPGDFNLDNTVDASDYVVWRKTDSTQAGYNTWRANFGRTISGGSGVLSADGAVPEPATRLILLLGLSLIVTLRRSRSVRTVPV
jgi:T5SS/PEP-CTERM-associated repeat protein